MIPLNESGGVGSSNKEFLHDIITTVLDITVIAWSEVMMNNEICATSSETHIAGCLGRAMIAEKNKRIGIKSQLRIEEEVGTRSSSNVPKPAGRIDIKIIYSFDETEYFGMECKRVSGKDKRLAKKYVGEGMMRFVTGKYGFGHKWGALLAFVIDGNSTDCINLICSQLANTRRKIRMKGDWSPETNLGSHKNLYRTYHRQHGQKSTITILHMVLNITSALPPEVIGN